MQKAMATLLMLSALAGCDDAAPKPGAGTAPQVPAILIKHDEPPIGSELNHQLVRDLKQTVAKLKPRWGDLQPYIYTVAPENRERLGDEMRKSLPANWKTEPLDGGAPRDTRFYGYSSGDAFFGALVIDPEGAPVIPVVILRNGAALDTTKG